MNIELVPTCSGKKQATFSIPRAIAWWRVIVMAKASEGWDFGSPPWLPALIAQERRFARPLVVWTGS
jgi:hypothetical protein